jgi:hypothetical protein
LLPRRIAVVTVVVLLASDRLAHAAPPDPPGNELESSAVAADQTDAVASALALCAAETNRYRASVGLAPLARSAALEAFATRAAAHDGAAGEAHSHFHLTRGGGVSIAETEIIGWQGFSLGAVVKYGLDLMWTGGPGGKHYDILTGPFSEIGCGVSFNGDGITVTQDFR